MDDISIFTNKNIIPDEKHLQSVLSDNFKYWKAIIDYTFTSSSQLLSEWNYPGQKYGWSFRIKDKKRAIIYLLPRQDYFKVAFVFGNKALELIYQSNIQEFIKDGLHNAKKYAEGKGIKIDVDDSSVLKDIFILIDIKNKY
jgi:hypothetical protein